MDDYTVITGEQWLAIVRSLARLLFSLEGFCASPSEDWLVDACSACIQIVEALEAVGAQ